MRSFHEERALWLSGVAGLLAAVVYACSSAPDEDASSTDLGAEAERPRSTEGAAGVAAASGGRGAAFPQDVAGAGGTRSTSSAGADAVKTSSAGAGGVVGQSATAAGSSGSAGSAGETAAGSGGSAGAPAAGSAGAAAAGSSGSASVASAGDPAKCTRDPATADNTSAVVQATEALLAALSSQQKTAIQFDKTLENAQRWSNLPTTFVPRNGVRIGDMSPKAQSAATALVDVAAGATGSLLFHDIRESDEWLVTDGKASSNDYGRALFYFSIHGTPSTSAPWMLQVAGHHLAYNFTYSGKCASATPLFDGVEPTSWTDSAGKAWAPLETQRAAMVALLAAVSSKSEAKLSGTFSDLIAGPVGGGPPGLGTGGGGGDMNYPNDLPYPTGSSGRGVLASTFDAAQKDLLKRAIEAWVTNVAGPVASALLASYESDEALAQTYVGYSGSTDLSTQSSYVRIDGPRVWIEMTIQGGIIYRDRVHYHTIWRDKAADYGAEYVSP